MTSLSAARTYFGTLEGTSDLLGAGCLPLREGFQEQLVVCRYLVLGRDVAVDCQLHSIVAQVDRWQAAAQHT